MRLAFLMDMLLVVVLAGSRGDAAEPPAVTTTITALIDVPRSARVVLIGEHHRSIEEHAFLRALVRDPRFAEAFTDVAVEFGNARLQTTADRYVAGEPVPEADLAAIWRETTQLTVWDAPMYRELFATVRTANATLPKEKRIRVLLGDAPIDWSRVEKPDDYKPFAARDPDFAKVLDRVSMPAPAGGRSSSSVVSTRSASARPEAPTGKTSRYFSKTGIRGRPMSSSPSSGSPRPAPAQTALPAFSMREARLLGSFASIPFTPRPGTS